jgi:hypothetical protein
MAQSGRRRVPDRGILIRECQIVNMCLNDNNNYRRRKCFTFTYVEKETTSTTEFLKHTNLKITFKTKTL